MEPKDKYVPVETRIYECATKCCYTGLIVWPDGSFQGVFKLKRATYLLPGVRAAAEAFMEKISDGLAMECKRHLAERGIEVEVGPPITQRPHEDN